MKIKLIGGSGYLGSKIHGMLLRRGIPVRNVDLLPSPLPNTTTKTDRTIFLAWPRMNTQLEMAPHEEYQAIKDLRVLFDEEVERSEHILFVSSVQAIRPENAYGRSKLVFEDYILEKYPDIVTVVRPSTLYGESINIRYDTILNHMVLDAVTRSVICVQGPEIIRAVVSIDRLAEFMIQCISNEPNQLIKEPLATTVSSIRELGGVVAGFTNADLIEERAPTPTRDFGDVRFKHLPGSTGDVLGFVDSVRLRVGL